MIGERCEKRWINEIKLHKIRTELQKFSGELETEISPIPNECSANMPQLVRYDRRRAHSEECLTKHFVALWKSGEGDIRN